MGLSWTAGASYTAKDNYLLDLWYMATSIRVCAGLPKVERLGRASQVVESLPPPSTDLVISADPNVSSCRHIHRKWRASTFYRCRAGARFAAMSLPTIMWSMSARYPLCLLVFRSLTKKKVSESNAECRRIHFVSFYSTHENGRNPYKPISTARFGLPSPRLMYPCRKIRWHFFSPSSRKRSIEPCKFNSV